MRTLLRLLPTGAVLISLAGAALAQTQVILVPRVFNDIPSAGYNLSASGSTVTLSENNVVASKGYANRDDWQVSSDAIGADTFGTNGTFDLAADLTFTSSDPNAQMEGGLRLSGPNDAMLAVKTYGDKAIFAAGGPIPFYLAAPKGAIGTPYHLEMKYGKLNPAAPTHNGFIIGVNGVQSAFLDSTGVNLENGIPEGTMIGGYFQIINPSLNGTATFSNITLNGRALNSTAVSKVQAAIPEPGSMALLGSSLLPLLAIRRRRR